MQSVHSINNSKYDKKFFEDVAPIKLTEARRIKLHTESWGILTDYYLESVKINRTKNGVSQTVATLKVGDKSGQIVCVVRGRSVGTLFGLSSEDWSATEKLCGCGKQLFYRYFKAGLSQEFGFEQRLFYNFCLSNQKSDVLVAVFKRGVNMRNRDRGEAFLEILDLRKCDSSLLDLYISQLRISIEKLTSNDIKVKS